MVLTAREQRLKAEREKYFIATGAVSIDLLDFPFSRDLKEENVRRLQVVFSGGRCTPERLEYRIPAIVSRSTFRDEWFRKDDEGLAALPGVRLQCLRGRHRVTAAQRLRQPLTSWVVDIYDSVRKEISDETQQDFVESNDSENPPDDGEFYYKVRLYQGAFGVEKADITAERRWRSRWTALHNITRDQNDPLKRLLGHPEYVAAFDQLHHLKALYSGMRLHSIGRMLYDGFDPTADHQEFLWSLYNLKKFWYDVFEKNEDEMQKFTVTSLEGLQRTAPGACTKQANSVRDHGFSEFTQNRQKYVENLIRLTTDMMVPSLETFFGNLRYIEESLRNCMTRLIKPRSRESFRSALEEAFTRHGQNECWIQVDEEHLTRIRTDDVFDLSYRQLVLFSQRLSDFMPPVKNPRKVGPRGDFADRRVLHRFAVLAKKLGFKTPQINDLAKREYFPGFHTVASARQEVDTSEEWREEQPRLYGKPNIEDFKRDRERMFLPQLHRPFEVQTATLSSFFIARSHYFSLFGDTLKTDLSKADLAERVPLLAASGEYSGTTGLLSEAEFESRNKQLEDKTKAAEGLLNELDAREKELNSLRDGLAAERQELVAQQQKLSAISQALETQRDLEAREAALSAGQQELQAQRQYSDGDLKKLYALRVELDNQQETSKRREEMLKTKEAALKRRDEALAAEEAALKTRDEERLRLDREQEAQRQSLAAKQEKLDALQLELENKQDELESWEEVLEEGERDLTTNEAALSSREEALTAREEALRNWQETLTAGEAALRAEEGGLEVWKQGLGTRQQELNAFQQDLQAQRFGKPHLIVNFLEARIDRSESAHGVSCKVYSVFKCSSAFDTEQRAINAFQEGWLVYCFNVKGVAEECPPRMCVQQIKQTGHRTIVLSRDQIPTEELPKLADLDIANLELKRKRGNENYVIKRRRAEEDPEQADQGP
ncbi:Reticulocyte-binding protein 2 a [Metarhizium anisopliae]